MKISSRIFAIGGLMCLLQCTAIAAELKCPASIMVSQAVIEPPSTWVAANSQRAHELSGAEFTYGRPAEMGFLRPNTVNKGKLRIGNYYFEGPPGSYWLNCHYEKTSVTVGQPISKELKQCGVVYEVGRRDEWKFQSIQCK